MSLIARVLGAKRDLPQLQSLRVANTAAGGSYEHALMALPDLTVGAPAGTAGFMPVNRLTIRHIHIIFEAAVNGAATNYFTINIRQWRNGAALGTNLASIAFSSGVNASAFVPVHLTPAAGNVIEPGDVITVQLVSTGTGLAAPAMTAQVEWVSEGFSQ